MYVVLMFGSRDWSDTDKIQKEIDCLKNKHGANNLLIIEGGAPGADQLSGFLGRSSNIHVAEIKALWETRGRGAGPQRNAVMASLRLDEAIGFHEDISKSRGTSDMKRKLDHKGVPARIVK
jgi:YspA, cpYpsA-related SLOG family